MEYPSTFFMFVKIVSFYSKLLFCRIAYDLGIQSDLVCT